MRWLGQKRTYYHFSLYNQENPRAKNLTLGHLYVTKAVFCQELVRLHFFLKVGEEGRGDRHSKLAGQHGVSTRGGTCKVLLP
jgi:hypothetical protein